MSHKKTLSSRLINTKKFKPWLVHGVTASGKTEIYMSLIEKQLSNSCDQVLVLIPEINLTPQLEARFQGRFSR